MMTATATITRKSAQSATVSVVTEDGLRFAFAARRYSARDINRVDSLAVARWVTRELRQRGNRWALPADITINRA